MLTKVGPKVKTTNCKKSGASCFWFMPHLDGECLELFLREVRTAFAQEQVVLVVDNHSSHTVIG
ncbi:hypothetical protein HYR54_10850 [Candidatus Acetothermia bacterium]|nr:hypothetical protein [Candidatus Acetothermia bacterium]